MTVITKNGRELARRIGREDLEALQTCSLIARHAQTAQRLAEMGCNGHPLQSAVPPHFQCEEQRKAYWARVDKAQARWDAWIDKRDDQITKRLRALVAQLGEGFRLVDGGDPRGCVIKVATPDGRYDNLGGEAVCAI